MSLNKIIFTHKFSYVKCLFYCLQKENPQICLYPKILISSYCLLKAYQILLLSIFLATYDKKSPKRKKINFLLSFLDFQIQINQLLFLKKPHKILWKVTKKNNKLMKRRFYLDFIKFTSLIP